MRVLVEIDNEIYRDIKSGKVYSSYREVPYEAVLAIANGMPLPEGHGDLVEWVKKKQIIDWLNEEV